MKWKKLGTLPILLAALASAQEYRGKVQGLVTDPSTAVVVGATVTLTNVNTGVDTVRRTDAGGRYLFDFVEPGHSCPNCRISRSPNDIREPEADLGRPNWIEAARALAPRVDLILFAQASMTRLAPAIQQATGRPVLTSPRLAIEYTWKVLDELKARGR